MRLKDKVCIVTGGASGLGRTFSLGLAGEGAKVAVCGHSSDPGPVVEEIKGKGGDAVGMKVDVRDIKSTEEMAAKTKEAFGRIDVLVANAGIYGQLKPQPFETIDPDEWFFKAHFFQDPVCPGSLGIESFIQLIKLMALQRWPQLTDSHRFGHLEGCSHSWTYRGQIVPRNKEVAVEAVVTGIVEGPSPEITADGWLQVDGLYIYAMKNYGLKLIHTP